MYIAFEGILGSGKSTQSKKLLDYLRYEFPEKDIVWTKEPGGTEIADSIREVVTTPDFVEEIEPICEAHLFAASRAQSLRKLVKPSLDSGAVVISDRCFISSLVNQAYGKGLDFEIVFDINKYAIKDIVPDYFFYIKIDVETGLSRAREREHNRHVYLDYDTDFYNKVLNGYDLVSKNQSFKDKWLTIDGTGTPDEVFERVKTAFKEKINL